MIGQFNLEGLDFTLPHISMTDKVIYRGSKYHKLVFVGNNIPVELIYTGNDMYLYVNNYRYFPTGAESNDIRIAKNAFVTLDNGDITLDAGQVNAAKILLNAAAWSRFNKKNK
jgi:hypothetical protein